MDTKICCNPDCVHSGEPQPIDNFNTGKNYKEGLRSRCKDCYSLEKRKYKKDNAEKIRAKSAQYHKNNARLISIRLKMKKYGISYDLASMYYDNLIPCAICKNNPAIPDHCHTTHKMRGPICRACNTVVGNAEIQNFTSREAIDRYSANLATYLKYCLRVRDDTTT